ncbi:glycoside hydrolase family 113 [Poriferisphaera sp. WC338]|uniref:glycoside hydrolase family 113 n=1 Tax=Poriferisphaera sp. WC338 TaxID=3425129 RepID=UPI003D81329B
MIRLLLVLTLLIVLANVLIALTHITSSPSKPIHSTGESFISDTTTPNTQIPGHREPQQPNNTTLKSLPTLRGFTLNMYHTDDVGIYIRAIDQIHALGCNAIQINTPVFMENSSSPTIELKTGPGFGPTAQHLTAVLNHAKSKDLITALMPQIDLYKPRGNEWRGKIHPERWEPWWQSYRQTQKHFLQIASNTNTDLFAVGSELLTTEKPTFLSDWRATIARARAQFTGKLYYSTNWDHYHAPPFWHDLDYIGINGYWDLTANLPADKQDDPTALSNRWLDIKQSLIQFSTQTQRPILFTEVGYPTLPWALSKPWNYINTDNIPANTAAQAQGYQSFLTAFAADLNRQQNYQYNKQQPFAGVFFFKWDVFSNGGPTDTGYSIQGKPAETVLRNYLQP